jgi:signal transduction histidine kinase
LHRNDHPVGCLTICSGTVEAFDQETKALLLEMAMDIDFALNNFAREAEKRRAAEALEASETRFRALFQNAPIGISLEDFSAVKKALETIRDGGISDLRVHFFRHPEVLEGLAEQVVFLDINLTGRAMAGVGDSAPTRAGRSRYASPEFLGAFSHMLVNLDAGKTSFIREVQFHDGQGRAVTYDVHLAVQPGFEADLARILVTFVDISERKIAEQAQKMESLGLLAGGVAHDMNNVLGAILGLASANLESQTAGSNIRRAFETIIQATERGRNVVQNLLSYARQVPAETRELDVNQLLRDVVALLEYSALSRIRLQMDLAEDLQPIRGDASALSHAFMNLCVNAVDAMPGGGHLTLRTKNLEWGLISVEAEDTGCGMTKEVLERALKPFFTTKGPGKGTGLGLSMVQSTVKAHKGRMEIQSEPGRGTRILMTFPACDSGTDSA